MGRAGREGAVLVREVVEPLRVGASVRQVVRRGQNERVLQLPGPAPGDAARQQGRDSVGGGAGRPADDLLPRAAPPGVPVCQRAQEPRAEGRRSGHHLHAHDPRAAGGHAGLRAAGSDSQRGVRGLLGGGVEDAHPGSGSGGGHHGRRRLAARSRDQVEARSGRSPGGLPYGARCDRLPANGLGNPDAAGPRPVVARS